MGYQMRGVRVKDRRSSMLSVIPNLKKRCLMNENDTIE